MTKGPKPRRLRDRFESHVDRSGECHIWTGATDRKGYGRIGVGSRSTGRGVYFVHRVAWELARGPIPDGMWVLHRCDNPPCVRVDHLFLGTSDDNVADMLAKKRHRPRGKTPLNIGERQRRIAAGRSY